MTPLGVGARLRAARAAARLTQGAVARQLHVGTATIANYEAERTAPSLPALGALAVLYGVSCDWLVTGRPRLPHGLSEPYGPEDLPPTKGPTVAVLRCAHSVPVRDRCPDCEQEEKERRLGP